MPDLVQGASKHTETLDDQGYLMPEELGIPQHVQRVLNQRGPKLSSTMTMPHLRHSREASGTVFENHPKCLTCIFNLGILHQFLYLTIWPIWAFSMNLCPL